MDTPRCSRCLSVLELHQVTVEDHGACHEALALMCARCEYVYELPTALPVMRGDDGEGLERCWMCEAPLPSMLRMRLEMCASCQAKQDARWQRPEN